jgi:hypothetical protein
MVVRTPRRQAPPSSQYLDENIAPRMLAVDGTFFGFAMLCVILRIYVKAFKLKTFGIDGMYVSTLIYQKRTDSSMSDWMMLLAAV